MTFLIKIRNTKSTNGATTRITEVIEADVDTKQEAFAFIPEGKEEYSSVEQVHLKKMHYVYFEEKQNPSEIMAYDEEQATFLASQRKHNKDLKVISVTLKKVEIQPEQVNVQEEEEEEEEFLSVGEEILQEMWEGNVPFISHMTPDDLKTIVLMKGHFVPLYIDELANHRDNFTELEKALLSLLSVGVNNPNLGKKLFINFFEYWSENEGSVAVTPFGQKAVSLIQKTAKQREQSKAKRMVSRFKS